MSLIIAIFIAVLPVVLLLLYFHFKVDRGQKEPTLKLVSALVTGIAIAFLAYFLEAKCDSLIYNISESSVAPFLQSFLIVALIEEGLKWLPLFFIFRRWGNWDEYSDAIMYVLCIGMGFALIENLIYARHGEISVSILRAFTAVPAHAIYAVLMGFFMSRFHFEKKADFLIMSFVLPWLLHGLYDFFIIQNFAEWLMLLAFVVLIGCLIIAVHLLKQTRLVDNQP